MRKRSRLIAGSKTTNCARALVTVAGRRSSHIIHHLDVSHQYNRLYQSGKMSKDEERNGGIVAFVAMITSVSSEGAPIGREAFEPDRVSPTGAPRVVNRMPRHHVSLLSTINRV